MRLVKPSFEIMAASGHSDLPYSYDRPLELIEAAGRTCYKSEDKAWTVCPECRGARHWAAIQGDCCVRPCKTCDGGKWKTSADKFVDMLVNRGHTAMLEHSWVNGIDMGRLIEHNERYPTPFIEARTEGPTGEAEVAGNLWAFAKLLDRSIFDLLPLSEWLGELYVDAHDLPPEGSWSVAMTVKFVCDRGVSHELVRHRVASYAQESTRYCNYGGGVTFVIPPWVDIEPGEYSEISEDCKGITRERWQSFSRWLFCCWNAEDAYTKLLAQGWRPEQARAVLPNSLKTEIVVTASLQEWRHIFKLRTAQAAHPQMREIMVPLYERAKKLYPNVFK